jgi:hypothetical protein
MSENIPKLSVKFIAGVLLAIIGLFLLLKNITVSYAFGFNTSLYRVGGMNLTSGFILVPFLIGVIMLFANPKNIFGWLLTFGSIALLIIGVITSINFTMVGMSALDIIIILGLLGAGIGLIFSSFRFF